MKTNELKKFDVRLNKGEVATLTLRVANVFKRAFLPEGERAVMMCENGDVVTVEARRIVMRAKGERYMDNCDFLYDVGECVCALDCFLGLPPLGDDVMNITNVAEDMKMHEYYFDGDWHRNVGVTFKCGERAYLSFGNGDMRVYTPSEDESEVELRVCVARAMARDLLVSFGEVGDFLRMESGIRNFDYCIEVDKAGDVGSGKETASDEREGIVAASDGECNQEGESDGADI